MTELIDGRKIKEYFLLNNSRTNLCISDFIAACKERKRGLRPDDYATLSGYIDMTTAIKLDKIYILCMRLRAFHSFVSEWITKDQLTEKKESDYESSEITGILDAMTAATGTSRDQVMRIVTHQHIHRLIELVNASKMNLKSMSDAINKLADGVDEVHYTVKTETSRIHEGIGKLAGNE